MKVHVTFANEYVAKAVLAACRRRNRELRNQMRKKPYVSKDGKLNITQASIVSLDDAIEELNHVVS